MILIAATLSVINLMATLSKMLRILNKYYAESRYAKCCYAECHYADCRFAEWHYPECPNT